METIPHFQSYLIFDVPRDDVLRSATHAPLFPLLALRPSLSINSIGPDSISFTHLRPPKTLKT
jgi:hypothetical protein